MSAASVSTNMDVEDSVQNIELDELKYLMQSMNQLELDDTDNVSQVLDSLVSVSKTSIEGTDQVQIDSVFFTLLQHQSKQIIAKTAKAIAEIAKTERGRQLCTNAELVTILLNLLTGDNIDILIQASRALGNICFENGNGKKLVGEKDGLRFILTILRRGIGLKDLIDGISLRNVAAGFLLNFLVDQEALYKKAFEEHIWRTVCNVLVMDARRNSETGMHCLLTLSIFHDAGVVFLHRKFINVLMGILISETSVEMSEMCLEMLCGQAENEGMKLEMARAGVCDVILDLLDKRSQHCTDEESRALLKSACNLIVLIITGDASMNLLYANSNGLVYSKLVEWLDNEDQDLKTTAVLCMGNFGRTDIHCRIMVVRGIHKKLFKILSKHNTRRGDIRLQHAILSALRNLVIPYDNKARMISDGLIDILYPMLDIPTLPIVFKLLGTLRIVIDGQREAAKCLGSKIHLVKRTIDWCNTQEDAGVRGEANRFIAWIINNSRDKEVVQLFMNNGAIIYLVNMLSASHLLMQNEAIISLSLVSAYCLPECEAFLSEANIGKALCVFFNSKECATNVSVVYNALALVHIITKSEILKLQIINAGLCAAWTKLLQRTYQEASIKQRIAAICATTGIDFN